MKFHLSLILTNNCNLDCVYCYERNKKNVSSNIDIIKKILEEHLNSDAYNEVVIDFFGGEPFLEFNTIREVCEWAWSNTWKNKYVFFATTNGTLIHGDIQDWLRTNKEKIWVSLSLDGKKESHDINRSNSFDQIDLKFFLECWPKQTVKMTISKETVKNLYDNIIYIHSLGYDITGTNFAEGIDWSDSYITNIVIEQLDKLCKFYMDNPHIKPVPLINMAIHKCEMDKKPYKWCGCGEYMAAYGINGEKYPCTFFTPMTFNTEQNRFLQTVDFTKYENFMDNDCYDNCYLEPICNNCYGANLLQTNMINKRDRSKCELMKVRAVFSAALLAHKLLQEPTDSYENYLKRKAIRKINNLYNID